MNYQVDLVFWTYNRGIKVIIERRKILKAMKNCILGIERGKQEVAGTGALSVINNTVYNYNSEVCTFQELDFDCPDGTVQADKIIKLLTKFKGDEIDISIKEDGWQITAGRTVAKVKHVLSDCPVHIESLKGQMEHWEEIPTGMMEALKLCNSNKNLKKELEGVFCKEGLMMGTDGARSAFHTIDSDCSFFLSERGARIATKIEPTKFQTTDNWLILRQENLNMALRKKYDQIYPFDQIKSVYTKIKENDSAFLDFPDDIESAIERVSVLSDCELNKPIVELTVENNGIRMIGKSAHGNIEEFLSKEYDVEEPISFIIDAHYFLEVVKRSNKFKFNTVNNIKMLMVEDSNFLQVVTGIRGVR
jgi:hypothetical protein